MPILLALVGASLAAGQESATLSVSEIVKAGEKVNFEIRLDKAPNFDGAVMYVVTSPGGTVQSGVEAKAGQTVCHGALAIPVDASTGTWAFSRLWFSYGTRAVQLTFKGRSFEVIGNSNLVYPSRAEVSVNPSQVQLLRREATRLQQRLQSLKASLFAAQRPEGVTSILRQGVQESISSLNTTASAFHELATGQGQLK
jgi:hypothetical protein